MRWLVSYIPRCRTYSHRPAKKTAVLVSVKFGAQFGGPQDTVEIIPAVPQKVSRLVDVDEVVEHTQRDAVEGD